MNDAFENRSSLQSTASVTEWLHALPADSSEATLQIWNRFVQRVAAFARRRLGDLRVRSVTAEDVAIDVFDGFFRRAKEGRISPLNNREDLWRVLARITNDRVIDAWRKRQPHLTESALGAGQDDEGIPPLLQVSDGEPNAEFAAEVAEELERLLELLEQRKPGLREVALLQLDGYTVPEISEHLDTPKRTVERRLAWIREICEKQNMDKDG